MIGSEATGSLIVAAAIAAATAVAVRVVCGIAVRRALLDHPNERSSHQIPVPRLGGVAMVPVMMLGWAWSARHTGLPGLAIAALFGGALLLFTIGLLDDLFSLSARVRLALQFAVVTGVIGSLYRDNPAAMTIGDLPVWCVVAAVTFWGVALVNIYNFMDGIDGIAGGQAMVAGLAWFGVATILEAPFSAALAAGAAGAGIGFLTLNWPPARIFMGDAGSTVLGYTFAVLPILTGYESAKAAQHKTALAAGILAVWPFVADGTFTIFRRLVRGENIFFAHRSHLYQRLVAAGHSHARVSAVYILGALTGGSIGLAVASDLSGSRVAVVVYSAVTFGALWIWTVWSETRARR